MNKYLIIGIIASVALPLAEVAYKRTKEVELTSNNAKDFKELSVIGINILKNLPNKTILVCGPISTGGLGSIEANLYKLRISCQ